MVHRDPLTFCDLMNSPRVGEIEWLVGGFHSIYLWGRTQNNNRDTQYSFESQNLNIPFFLRCLRLDGVATGVLQGYSTTTTTSKPTGYNYSTLTLL